MDSGIKFSKSYYIGLEMAKAKDIWTEEWADADEMDVSGFYFPDAEESFGKITAISYDTDYYFKSHFDVEFNPDCDGYDKCVVASVTHSGDWQYMNQCVYDAIDRILYGRCLRKWPEEGSKLHFVVGNAIVANEHKGEWKKEHITTRTVVLIPYTVEVDNVETGKRDARDCNETQSGN